MLVVKKNKRYYSLQLNKQPPLTPRSLILIYEFRTYDILPGNINQVIQKFSEKIDGRNSITKIGAFWYTEIGPLNQIIHVWPYKNMEHRNSSRKEAMEKGLWPPDASRYMVTMNTEFWLPVSFSPEWTDRNIGPFFEMRIYTYPPLQTDIVIEAWKENLDKRNALSPLVGAFVSEVGNVNKFMHIWAYKSLQHRTEAREQFPSIEWPPKNDAKPPIKMENKIVVASDFSPIK